MSTVVIEDFKAGLDARNMPEATLAGALLRADNCVINYGGEVEKLEAWRKVFNLPEFQTYGLEIADDEVHVFGTDTPSPKLPQKVQYVQLAPASGANMTGVLDTELFDGKIYVIATFDDGKIVHFYDGVEITDWVDGGAVNKFTITTGSSGNIERVIVKIGLTELELLTGNVPFNGTIRQTAKDVAENISNTKTIPNFRATSLDDEVIITRDEEGTAANSYKLEIRSTGMLTDVPNEDFTGGFALPASKFQAGTYAKTATSKMYVLAKSILHFSAIDDPTDFDPRSPVGTGTGVGAGFINIANHARGNEQLVAIAEYFERYAIYGKDTIQIWSLDADEDLNARVQTIRNSGAISAYSVVGFGVDTAYLDRSGIRSLRSRDSSRSANVNDIGTAIDPIIQDLIVNQANETKRSQAAIDPLTGRYFLSIGKAINIFSFFPSNKVSGWTRSLPGFEVEKFAQRQLRIIARYDDGIYQLSGSQQASGFCDMGRYGSATNADAETNNPDAPYADSDGNVLNRQADIITPFIDAGDPSRFKVLKGLDLVIEGQWQVYLLTDPRDISKQTEVCKIENSSLKLGRIPMNAHSTHFALRFVSIGSDFSRISKILGHFDSAEQE
jgi:hypothetical protein